MTGFIRGLFSRKGKQSSTPSLGRPGLSS